MDATQKEEELGNREEMDPHERRYYAYWIRAGNGWISGIITNLSLVNWDKRRNTLFLYKGEFNITAI